MTKVISSEEFIRRIRQNDWDEEIPEPFRVVCLRPDTGRRKETWHHELLPLEDLEMLCRSYECPAEARAYVTDPEWAWKVSDFYRDLRQLLRTGETLGAWEYIEEEILDWESAALLATETHAYSVLIPSTEGF